jgi:hypothetical protein
MFSQNVELVERRTSEVSRDEFFSLESSIAGQRLVDSGVLTLVRGGRTGYGIRANAFVGTAMLDGGVMLRIAEKVCGSVAGMISSASPVHFRETAALGPVWEADQILEILFRRFLAEVNAYASRGRHKDYHIRAEVSAIPRGRLDVRKTVRMWAAGGWPRLAQTRSVLSADLPSNQVIVAALRLAEAFASGRPSDKPQLEAARHLLARFSDVNSQRVLSLAYAQRRRFADQVLTDQRMPERVARCVRWATPLLLGNSLWGTSAVPDALEAYFLNLENLFEQAVLGAASGTVGYSIQHGRDVARAMFPLRPGRFLAEPDLVCGSGSRILFVGDCKYKTFDGSPEHSDVYQLLCHAEAFGTRTAVLIYPDTSRKIEFFGETRSGAGVWIATVRPTALNDDVVKIISHLAGCP